MRPTYLIAIAAAAATVGCQSVDTTQAGVVGVDRQQRMAVSAEQMNQGAEKAYAEMMAEAKAKGVLNKNPAHVERVRAIAKRLIPHTAAFRQDAPAWKWEVNVLELKDVNAWAMPGGKMAVYSGLIENLKVSDDELAAVMGHEMSHALREHSRERASRAVTQGALLGVLGAVTGVSGGALDLSKMVLDVTRPRPTASAWSWRRAPATTRGRRSRSGKRCRRAAAASRRSSSRRIPRTRTASTTCASIPRASCRSTSRPSQSADSL
jgi:predicted Zn-dependent protease